MIRGCFQLRIRNLSYSYESGTGSVKVFDSLNCNFDFAGFYMILGKSGCGKSTLLSLIAGFLVPTGGEITDLPGKPAVVFQDSNLLENISVMDNVSLPLTMEGVKRSEREEKARIAMKKLGIEHLKSKKARDISGGEKMRTSLARALVQSRGLILADEPTGALDKKNSNEVMKILKEVSSDTVVVCVTHNEDLAFKYGDMVLRLENMKLHVERNSLKRQGGFGKEEGNAKLVSFKDSLAISNSFLYKRKGRLFATALALGFAFGCLSASLSIRENRKSIGQGIAKGFFDYRMVHASEKTNITQKNGMVLSKNLPLSEEFLERIKRECEIEAYPSLSFFMPSAGTSYYLENKVAYQIEPVIFEDEYVDDIYVRAVANDSLMEALGKKQGDIVTIKGEGRSSVVLETNDTIVFEKNWNLKIEGISDETKGFSTPTLFYDYRQVYEILAKTAMTSGQGTYLDYLEDEEFYDDNYRGYETLLVSNDTIALEELRVSKYKDRLSLSSRGLSAIESADTIIESVTSLATMFLGLAILVAFFILLFSLTTIMTENKKSYATVLAFSKDKKSFVKLYRGIPAIFLMSSFGVYGISCVGLFNLLPKLLAMFGYPNFIATGFTPLSVGLMLVAMLLLTVAGAYFSYIRIVKKELLLSLRCER